MDAGTYTASVEAILPATGGQVYILKSFEVTVNPQGKLVIMHCINVRI